jgi:RNA polymerase sigma-70 factor (ECF subfamily)
MTIGDDFEAVLDAARQGADWAVAALFRDLHPRLLRYLRARAPEVADDLASEVWLAAARGLPGFEGDEPAFRAWMFTIARRQVIGHWRKAGRRRTDPAPREAFESRPARDEPDAVVLADLSAQEAVDALTSALSPDQAEVVLLRVLGGLDVETVARVIGKRVGTVRVLQHRALRRLAKTFPTERSRSRVPGGGRDGPGS